MDEPEPKLSALACLTTREVTTLLRTALACSADVTIRRWKFMDSGDNTGMVREAVYKAIRDNKKTMR